LAEAVLEGEKLTDRINPSAIRQHLTPLKSSQLTECRNEAGFL
jgi:hypothetical protein